MKKIFNIALSALLGLSLSGCDDFLSLVPLNDVVLENFWTDKADVESVLLGVYSSLESSDCITRMGLWGEMRSDNMVAASTASNDITQILKDNILETNSYTSWSCFYSAINRANTVLYYAPGVAEKDPNYTDAELKGHLAEAYTLRALAYFYLIRAYRDVPYITNPSKDDEEDFVVAATQFDVILDDLIKTLEDISVPGKEWAVNRFKELGDKTNNSRITRVAVWALLSDMYLWRACKEMPMENKKLGVDESVAMEACIADLDKCIENCEKVIARKVVDYKELKDKQGADCIVEYYNDIPLIMEAHGSTTTGTAYNEIFGTGNSFESLFELVFMPYQSTANSFVNDYYGSSSSNGSLSAFSQLITGAKETSGNKYFKKYDSRWLESMEEGSSSTRIVKYVRSRVSIDVTAMTPQVDYGTRASNQDANWIIYRLSDVVLMEAEAKVMKARLVASDTKDPAAETLLKEAFDYTDAVYRRAVNINNNTSAQPLSYTDFSASFTGAEEMVLLERRRELMFEGKRWFDLVRMCERDGNTKRLVSWVLLKHTENQSAIRIKLADMDAIYFPISKDELKINPLLKQNKAYIEDEYISKN